jgi:shikimate kinase
MKNKIITLIGYMGSGKSTIGKLLAKELAVPFIDLDQYISDKEEISISDYFKKNDEAGFRVLELKYLEEILRQGDACVLALGGGTPTVSNAMELINKHSTSFYLKCSVATLTKRLSPNTIERPILSDIATDYLESYIEGHLKTRIKHYNKADNTISVDQLSKSILVTVIQKITQYQ